MPCGRCSPEEFACFRGNLQLANCTCLRYFFDGAELAVYKSAQGLGCSTRAAICSVFIFVLLCWVAFLPLCSCTDGHDEALLMITVMGRCSAAASHKAAFNVRAVKMLLLGRIAPSPPSTYAGLMAV